jgi:hypothetical protein
MISTRCIRTVRRRVWWNYVASVRRFDLQREDFLAIVDGMEMDVPPDIRAPDLATLDLYCDRVGERGRTLVGAGVRSGAGRRASCSPTILAARCN